VGAGRRVWSPSWRAQRSWFHCGVGAALGIFFVVVCDDRCCARLSSAPLFFTHAPPSAWVGVRVRAVSAAGAVRCGVVHGPASLQDAAVLSHQRPSYLPSREIKGEWGRGRGRGENKAQLQRTQDHLGHTWPGASWVEGRRAQLKTENVTCLSPGARSNSPPPHRSPRRCLGRRPANS
jgi:hypothetical protein